MEPSLLPDGSQRLGSILFKATHTDKAEHPGSVRPVRFSSKLLHASKDAGKSSFLHQRDDNHSTCFCQCLLLLLHRNHYKVANHYCVIQAHSLKIRKSVFCR